MKNRTLVLVYGTLREGESNHRHLAGAEALGSVKTAPLYRMIDLGAFPGVLEGGTTAITGELYRVDDATLARLDQLEGHPGFYRRMDVELDADVGAVVQGYVLPNDYATRPVITSGDWRSSPYSRHWSGKRIPTDGDGTEDSPEECD